MDVLRIQAGIREDLELLKDRLNEALGCWVSRTTPIPEPRTAQDESLAVGPPEGSD